MVNEIFAHNLQLIIDTPSGTPLARKCALGGCLFDLPIGNVTHASLNPGS
jgi:hypothetical protein